MSTECPDDTKSLNLISGIFQCVLFYVGVPKEEYDNRFAVAVMFSIYLLYRYLLVFEFFLNLCKILTVLFVGVESSVRDVKQNYGVLR